jgi:chromosome segregation ATPase
VQLLLHPCISRQAVSTKSRKKQKGADEVVQIRACINSEGSRVFRLNNKIVSGKEVRKKLGKIGVHLGTSTSLILQSAVTELADSTDPLALAAVIAECSGLEAWAKEAANAHAELEAQGKDELQIRQKIEALKRTSLAARVEASKGEKYGQLEAQAEEAAEVCWKQIDAVRAAAAHQREKIVEMLDSAVESEHCLQNQEAEAQQKLAKVCEQYHLDDSKDMNASNDSIEANRLRLARISIEEELQLVSDQLKSYGTAATAHAREKDVAQRCELVLREIELLEQGLREIQMQSSSLEASKKVQQEVDSLKLQLLEAQHDLKVAEASSQHAQKQLNDFAAEMNQTINNLKQYRDLMENKSSDDVDCQLVNLAALRAELQFKESALAKQQQLKLQLPPKYPNGFKLSPLVECFRFKDPSKAASQYAHALEVLAGRHLNIAVAQSTQQAAQLLACGSPRGLRIWALDANSTVPDRIQAYRQVAASFLPAGSVIVPMDLLSFDAAYQGVIAKAFASHVIVSSVETGRQVMEQYGIPSIAVDGTVTSRGRLVGGWVPPVQQHRGLMHSKIRSDLQNANLYGVRDQLTELDSVETTLKAQIEAKAAQAAAEEAVVKFKAAQGEALSAEKSYEKSLNAVEILAAELNSRRTVAAALGQACSRSGSAASSDQIALLRLQIAQGKNLLESLQHDKCVAEKETAAATTACPPGGIQEDNAELQAAYAQLQDELREKLKEIDHQLLILDKNIKMKQQRRIVAHYEEESRLQKELAAAAEGLCAVAIEKATLDKQLTSLDDILKEMGTLEAESNTPINNHHQPSSFVSGTQLDFSDIESMAEEVRSTAAKHASLLAELASLKSLGIRSSSVDAVASLRAAEIAERELSLLRPQADTMHGIALKLAEGVQLMNPSAEQLNESVFDTVAAFFKDLTAQLLPGIELRVTRVDNQGATIHRNGAQFSYRRRNGGIQEENWVTGLEALSGGQRTLISLAYLVSAKAVGGPTLSFSSSVLLADEVDAALDSTNQEQAARLLRMLCTKKDISSRSTLAQVICISHSPIFQQLCDKVIKLTRNSEDGTTMLAPNLS